jgi:hypothetical protein
VSIVRAPRPKGNFYILDKRISEDSNLSWGARGMLIFLLGKPDNWRVSIQNLVNETSGSKRKSGRDAVYAYIAELKEAGYITVYQNRTESGVFGETDYLVHEHSEPLPENPDTAVTPLTGLPDTACPDTVNPDTVMPNTADPPLISNKLQEISTTTNTRVDKNNETRSSEVFVNEIETEFDKADHESISAAELSAIKPIICEWVRLHKEKSIQDWIDYYAASAQFEAKRGRPIQRPSAFIHAVMQNPTQDWTQANAIQASRLRKREQTVVLQRQETESLMKSEHEAKLVTESLATFYECSVDRQEKLLVEFRRNKPAWAKLDLKSKVFQHVLAEWLRENQDCMDFDELHSDRRTSSGEWSIKQ